MKALSRSRPPPNPPPHLPQVHADQYLVLTVLPSCLSGAPGPTPARAGHRKEWASRTSPRCEESASGGCCVKKTGVDACVSVTVATAAAEVGGSSSLSYICTYTCNVGGGGSGRRQRRWSWPRFWCQQRPRATGEERDARAADGVRTRDGVHPARTYKTLGHRKEAALAVVEPTGMGSLRCLRPG